MLYAYSHSPIPVYFAKNSDNFIVRECLAYELLGQGEWLYLNIEKKDMSTPELLKYLSSELGVKQSDLGYAGLKDKQGLTSQWISLPKRYESELSCLNKIKIKDCALHENKLKIGHLKGNSFFIRLKKVNPTDAKKLTQVFESIAQQGFANYFGFQRFGKSKDNFNEGLDILRGKLRFRDKKLAKFLVQSAQSELFNKILEQRLMYSHFAQEFSAKEIESILKKDFPLASKYLAQAAKYLKKQKTPFKLLLGDLFEHFPKGRLFYENENELERFLEKDISPTGILLGGKSMQPQGFAALVEESITKDFTELFAKENGARRHFWSFADECKSKYDEKSAQFSLEFFLQKGCYATVLLEELLHVNVEQ